MLNPELEAYARGEARKLDEWAKGALFGFVFGWAFGLGVLWAAGEALK